MKKKRPRAIRNEGDRSRISPATRAPATFTLRCRPPTPLVPKIMFELQAHKYTNDLSHNFQSTILTPLRV